MLEDIPEQLRPFRLPGSVRDLIVADLDHRAGNAARTRMPFQREIDAVGWRIGLVDANVEALRGLQFGDQRSGKALFVVMDDADLPRAGEALVDRREGMD